MRFLIVVDMQQDFVSGTLGTKEARAILQNVGKKIRNFDGKILVTLDTHGNNYQSTQEGQKLPVPHCLYGTPGWGLHNDILDAFDARGETCMVDFKKPTFGSVELANYLWAKSLEAGGVDEIVFIGLCTDICVISNALLVKAFIPDVKITVDAACCAGVTPESHENALKAMEMCQVNIENWRNKNDFCQRQTG